MKQLITLALFTLIFFVQQSFGVTKDTLAGKVTGQVVDNQHQPLAYATVTLLKAADSSLVKGAITEENGDFSIEQIADGKYMIATSVVGYTKTFSKTFSISDNHPAISLKTIELQPSAKALKGVDVTATKPFIEHKLDKTVVNVENSSVSAGNTALEVLERSPGVTVDNNGNISLKGKSGVVIMIDGKPTYLSQDQLNNLLKSMSANAISQIEIMTNPSAKYDAAGNAGIINIKLKKNANEGMNGSVIAGYSQGMYAHYNAGANLNYKKGKVNLFANYNYSKGTWWNTLDLSRKFYDNGSKNPTTLMQQHSFMKFPNTDQSLKAGMDYNINDKNTIGVMVNANYSAGQDITNGPIHFYDGTDQLDSTAVPTNHNHNNWNSVTYNLNYKLEIDTGGQELTANFDYSTFDNSSHQTYNTDFYKANGDLLHEPKMRIGDLPSNIDIKSGKIDYTLPIKKTAKLEAGLKSSIVTSDNNVQYQNYNNGKWENDNGASNHFIYKENINAAYLNFNKEFKKGWSAQLGLRGEQTVSKANQLTIDSIVNRNYFQLFPSAFIKKDINKNNSLSISYSRRIDRPDYQDLNPFRYYVDDYTYEEGNPFLQPQLTNSFELSHSYKGKFTTTLNYSHTSDVITQVLKQNDSTRTTFQTRENLNTMDNYGIEFSVPVNITKWWMINTDLNVFHNQYKGALNSGSLNQGITTVMFHMNNSFTLPAGFTAELSGFYRSKFVFGPLVGRPMYRVDMGLQKSFFEKSLNVKLNVNDIFNIHHFDGYMKYQNIDVDIQNHWESRRVGLTLTYNFGNKNLKMNNHKSGIEDEQNRIKK